MSSDFDIIITGAGFAGALMAMIARRLGHSVLLVERGRHPRFAIGESSTPMANLLLEELARRYDLPEVASFSKWGIWQKTHPEIACGLKRGFSFYHHRAGECWVEEADRRNQLLVAASPHDAVADTHWYRPDFDQFLVGQAIKLGAEYLDGTQLNRADFSAAGAELSGERLGRPMTLRARLVVDASGPRGFLHRALDLPETPFRALPDTQALYTHFEDVTHWQALHHSPTPPPYAVDDAAMHHVFDGGWIWVLRFNNGITSAGIAAKPGLAEELRLAEGAPGWERVLERLPSVREQFAEAKVVLPFWHASRLPFRTEIVAGERWALLPSAAGFVDPLLSTGFTLTLLGIERLARILEKNGDALSLGESRAVYSRQTLGELDFTSQLIAALYAHLDDFEMFAALTQLYFAAVIYSETQRRLGTTEGSFLLQDHPTFGPASRDCLQRANGPLQKRDRLALLAAISQTIDPINLAGLAVPSRRNWYPCVAADLLAAAPKLGVSQATLSQLLTRCGFE